MGCQEKQCKKQAIWAKSYGLKPQNCYLHKQKDFVNVYAKRCTHEGCNISPSYSQTGKKPLRCFKHRILGDILRGKKCYFTLCNKIPSFGPIGGKPVSCSTHKEHDHINLLAKICEIDNCNIQAAFGTEKGKPLRCDKHKLDGHINVKGKACEHIGCKTRANFSQPGELPLRCELHKISGDINVTNDKCEVDECNKRPSFSEIGKKASRCGDHKKDNDINVIAKRCEQEGCEIQPVFGKKENVPIRCNEHKMNDDVNVKEKRCNSESCMSYNDFYDRGSATNVNPKTGKRDLCGHCFRSLHPELSILKVRKEHLILSEVQRMIPELEPYFLSWDCKIPGQSCSTSQPDMVWKVQETLIHIEVDENGESHEDDHSRIVGIHSSSGCKNHILIRFNPDASSDGSPSCLRKIQLQNGEFAFSTNKNEWNKRIQVLINHVREAYENSKNGIETIPWKCKLFF